MSIDVYRIMDILQDIRMNFWKVLHCLLPIAVPTDNTRTNITHLQVFDRSWSFVWMITEGHGVQSTEWMESERCQAYIPWWEGGKHVLTGHRDTIKTPKYAHQNYPSLSLPLAYLSPREENNAVNSRDVSQGALNGTWMSFLALWSSTCVMSFVLQLSQAPTSTINLQRTSRSN